MGKSQSCYCAFCKHERKIYEKKHISFVNVLLSVLVAFLLMYVFWQELDARVVILFVASICLSEIFILLRWRLSMPCPYCGFDPVLYKRSATECARKVQQFLEMKKSSPATYLHAKNPFQHLKPVLKKRSLYELANSMTSEALPESVTTLKLQENKPTKSI